MFQRLWPGLRSPATTKFSRIYPSRIWLRPRTNASFFDSGIISQKQGSRTRLAQFKVLQAGIYGTICMSMALLVTDTSLSFKERQDLAIQTALRIAREEDEAKRLQLYWETGRSLLEKYSGAAVEDYGNLRLDQWRDDELEARLAVTPDPDVPGGLLILCQAALSEADPSEVYVAQHTDRISDVMMDLLTAVEDFARHRGLLVRGVVLLLDAHLNWFSVYFDGKRWLNVVYFETQTPESLGYHGASDDQEA
ncbi:hypothetical protein F5Y11DRAFT_319380 [Daldinia sp. FL1419]|nr:hypothetical protein F5Y11DRAFT_319380 [Daldinia sp. FL1419]